MSEFNSIETLNKYSNLNAILLSDQTKFRLHEINKIKYSFNSERKITSEKLSKCIAAFDCFICNKWRNKYYFLYKCYWSSCSNSKCKF